MIVNDDVISRMFVSIPTTVSGGLQLETERIIELWNEFQYRQRYQEGYNSRIVPTDRTPNCAVSIPTTVSGGLQWKEALAWP